MCTAIGFKQKSRLFGRNLDLEYHFNEEVVITPRNFKLEFRHIKPIAKHFAFFGIATVIDGCPLYYDAVNEHGIAVAGLNFAGNAKFQNPEKNKYSIAQFELIPFILGQARNLDDAKLLIQSICLVDTPFDEKTPVSELHFFITDGTRSITVEPDEEKIHIYENQFGTLTNNPPFPFHCDNINNYRSLSPATPENTFAQDLDLKVYSKGMGTIGLPGDLSSSSRFIRAAFTKFNALKKSDKDEEISQAFHILESVYQVEGCVNTKGLFERTQYTSVANLSSLTYFYKSYTNSRITAVKMKDEELSGSFPVRFPLRLKEDMFFEN